ncbi:MAG TPA: S8 family serine peptidase [Longimicrobiales bacterium]
MIAARARVRPRARARVPVLSAGFLAGAAFAALAFAAPLAAQQADSVVWVWLDDAAFPADAPAAVAPASLARRARTGVGTFDNDAPIPDTLVRALEDAGLRVRHRSRWLRAVSGAADAAALGRVRALPSVARVTPVASLAPPPVPADASGFASSAAPPSGFYGIAYEQVAQIGVPLAHDLGLTGAGVVVALLDTGFRDDHVALAGLDVIATRDFIQGDSVVENESGDPASQHNHGTQVWSALAGHAPDEFVGPAYGASFLLAKVDHVTLEPLTDEDRWVAAIEWADSMGADIVSSSLGYRCFDTGFCWTDADLNGDSAPSTIAADEAARRGILVVTAVGNEGAGDLIAPADGDSVLAVGAVDANGTLATFSSTGPTGDGRIKPDLVARGVTTWLANPGSTTSYVQSQGTSFATPLVAGAAALFLEAWPALGGMDAYRALLASGSVQPANASVGHGLPDIASAILFPRGIVPVADAQNRAGGVMTTLAPSFRWNVPLLHAGAGSVEYVVQVARDAQFTDIAASDTVVDAETTILERPLAAGTYWWRVVARTEQGVVRSSAATGPFTMSPWVRLVTLNDPAGIFIDDPTPELAWDPLPAPPPIGPLVFDVNVVAASSGALVAETNGVNDTTLTVVDPLQFNVSYRWRVVTRTAGGAVDTTTSVGPFVVTSAVAPPATLLYQNFPNPFPRGDQSITTIWFDLHDATRVQLAVYDLRGRLVRRLIPDALEGCSDEVRLAAGTYGRIGDSPCVATTWDGTTDQGEIMPAGVYIIRLITESGSHSVRTLFRP